MIKNIILLLSISLLTYTIPTQAETDLKEPFIAKAVFTTNVQKRIPQDNLTTHDNHLKKIFFFTDVKNLSGTTITHRWIYKDRIMAEVPLPIGGPRWRTWSSKNLWHTWTGKWQVQVLTEDGNTLLEKSFIYTKKTTNLDE